MPKQEDVTIVILSEHEGKQVSARYALRCICRDLRMFVRALWRNVVRFFRTFRDGHRYVTCWWTRDEKRQDPRY